jgi:hypothetical protein
MLKVFLEESNLNQINSLKNLFCSGEALSNEIKNKFLTLFPKVHLSNLY